MIPRDKIELKLFARRWSMEVVLSGFVALMLSYTWMYGDISVPNERSRVYLAVALVDEGVVAIDGPLERWGKIYDLAVKDDHFYSDKAPGSSFLGAVVYGVARLFTEPNEWTIRELINLMRTWLMIPISLIGFVTLRRILEYVGLDPPVVDIASLAWILGTAAFHYGAAYFGHQIVAVALLVSLYFVMRAEEVAGSGSNAFKWWMVAGGAAAGVAGLTEYQAAVPCILLTLYAAAANPRIRRHGMLPWIAGAAPFVLLLVWYNETAFGGPFELSYHYLADEGLREIHGEGIAGVTIPTWEAFSGSMFSLHRGLFGTSPLFLAALPGFYYMVRRREKRLALFVGLTFLYFVAFVSSSNMWFAGWGFGPRLLVPCIGLLMIPVAYGIQAAMASFLSEALVKGLAVAQVIYVQLVVVFFPEPPETAENPILDYVGLMWAENVASPNLGQKLLGMDPAESVRLAMFLTLFVVVFLVFRGTGTIKKGARFIIVGGVVVTLLVGATIVQGVGPSWDEQQRQKWMRLVERWDARESPGDF